MSPSYARTNTTIIFSASNGSGVAFFSNQKPIWATGRRQSHAGQRRRVAHLEVDRGEIDVAPSAGGVERLHVDHVARLGELGPLAHELGRADAALGDAGVGSGAVSGVDGSWTYFVVRTYWCLTSTYLTPCQSRSFTMRQLVRAWSVVRTLPPTTAYEPGLPRCCWGWDGVGRGFSYWSL